MSSSAFYRSQAARLLEQAEQAELLEKLYDAEAGTVITYNVQHRRNITLTYAALVIKVEGETDPRWYTTGFGGNHCYTTEEMVRYLINASATNVNVWDHATALSDWPMKTDTEVDVTPEDNSK